MADGKKKRSLREAFGVIRPTEEKSAPEAASGGASAVPVSAPEGGSPAPVAEGEAEKKPAARKQGHAGSKDAGSSGGTRGRRKSTTDESTSDPVITGDGARKRSAGRGRASSRSESGGEEAPEMVPGKGGKMVAAETPVNMTFTVTAKERYLWTLELKRRGLTAVGVLRETMKAMVGEERG